MPREAKLSEPQYHDISVVVSAGSGSAILHAVGWAAYTLIDGPDGASWSLSILDKDSKPITGRANQTDDLVFIEEYPLKIETTFAITGTNGTYNIRVWKKFGR